MAALHNQNPHAGGPIADDSDDERARKRVEIGLSPSRPTAKESLQRPPDSASDRERERGFPFGWLLSGVMVAMVGATVLLLFARLVGAPTQWSSFTRYLSWWVQDNSTALVDQPTYTIDGYRILVSSGFADDEYQLAHVDRPGQYQMGVAPESDAFYIITWPNRLAWATPGSACLAPHYIETHATVTPTTPDGYVGLVGRVNDSHNFYLFVVDGLGRYQVLLQRHGAWTTLRSWTAAPAINPAGESNMLALDDDGQSLRFSANGVPLFITESARLPAGHAGLAAGAQSNLATAEFDWFALYDRPCRSSS